MKYSEESHHRDGNDTLMEGWQSFQRENKSRGKKRQETKHSFKDFDLVQEPLEDRYYEVIKEEIVGHLNVQKVNLKE